MKHQPRVDVVALTDESRTAIADEIHAWSARDFHRDGPAVEHAPGLRPRSVFVMRHDELGIFIAAVWARPRVDAFHQGQQASLSRGLFIRLAVGDNGRRQTGDGFLHPDERKPRIRGCYDVVSRREEHV